MAATQRISPQHPALPGHFPGNPLVPGVVILQRVLQAAASAGHRVSTIANAKFTAPLLADEGFTINLLPRGERLQFEVHSDTQLIAQGSLDVAPIT